MCRLAATTATVLLCVVLAGPSLAQSEATKTSHCQAVYNEVWELRAKGKEGPANSLHGRARHYGCFELPISRSLCPILEEQELRREAAGDTGLAGVIRAQKRRFACA